MDNGNKRSRTDGESVGASGEENQRSGLLEINNLTYNFPDDLSVITHATKKENMFHQRIYKDGETMIVTLMTGADYIDPVRSYLSFVIDMKATSAGDSLASTAQCGFGRDGTALNVIRQIQVNGRSGDEIMRCEHFNVKAFHEIRANFPEAWWEMCGDAMGQPTLTFSAQHQLTNAGVSSAYSSELKVLPTTTDSETGLQKLVTPASVEGLVSALKNANGERVVVAGRRKINIPLYCLGGIFATGKLIPQHLASGMTIRIELEKAEFATVWGCPKAIGSEITDGDLTRGVNKGVCAVVDDSGAALADRLDADRAVDTNTSSADELMDRLAAVCKEQKLDVDESFVKGQSEAEFAIEAKHNAVICDLFVNGQDDAGARVAVVMKKVTISNGAGGRTIRPASMSDQDLGVIQAAFQNAGKLDIDARPKTGITRSTFGFVSSTAIAQTNTLVLGATYGILNDAAGIVSGVPNSITPMSTQVAEDSMEAKVVNCKPQKIEKVTLSSFEALNLSGTSTAYMRAANNANRYGDTQLTAAVSSNEGTLTGDNSATGRAYYVNGEYVQPYSLGGIPFAPVWDGDAEVVVMYLSGDPSVIYKKLSYGYSPIGNIADDTGLNSKYTQWSSNIGLDRVMDNWGQVYKSAALPSVPAGTAGEYSSASQPNPWSSITSTNNIAEFYGARSGGNGIIGTAQATGASGNAQSAMAPRGLEKGQYARRQGAIGKVGDSFAVIGKNITDRKEIKAVEYRVENPKLIVHACQLTDSSQRTLNALSAANGLELVYHDWSVTTMAHQPDEVHIEVKKAVSRAVKAFAVPRTSSISGAGTAVGVAASTNTMAAQAFRARRYQWQLGSLYFPHQSVETDPADTGASASSQTSVAQTAYYETLDAFGRYTPQSAYGRLDLAKYKGRDAGDRCQPLRLGTSNLLGFDHAPIHAPLVELSPNYAGGGILACTLERNAIFKMSGIPINNSRVLILHAIFDKLKGDLANQDRDVDVFLKYVKVARVFLHNVEVES